MINQLHPVPQLPGPPLYCGPTAICAVTGVPPHRATWAIQRVRGNWDRVVGVDDYEMCAALALLGFGTQVYVVNPVRRRGPPTFARFIKEMDRFDGACILVLSGHYVAASYTEMVDNHTDGKIVPLINCPNRSRYVHRIIESFPLAAKPLRRTTPRRVDPPTLSP